MKHLSQLSQSLGQVIAVAQGLGTSHLQIILNAGRHTHLRSRSGDKPLRSRGDGLLTSKSMQTVRVQTDRSYNLASSGGQTL